ncbi:DUF443 family protein [Enterococcus rotai]|nr:DUF443 family protein [Enterococcus rotai]
MIKLEFTAAKPLYNNHRYNVIHSQSNYYLIDKDSSFLGYFFFGLNWLMPQKAYILNKSQADDLLAHRVETKNRKVLSSILIVLMILIFNIVLPKLLTLFYASTSIENSRIIEIGNTVMMIPPSRYIFMLLLITLFPALIIRVFWSFQSKKSMLKIIKYDELSVTQIKVRPGSLVDTLKKLGVYFMFLSLVIIAGFLLVITEGYWIISLCLVMLFLLFLLTNHLSINTGKYKIYQKR